MDANSIEVVWYLKSGHVIHRVSSFVIGRSVNWELGPAVALYEKDDEDKRPKTPKVSLSSANLPPLSVSRSGWPI